MDVEKSILLSVKKLIGIEPDDTEFDVDIISNINAALMILIQMGVGPKEGFTVTSSDETYEDFLGDDMRSINMVKVYLPCKVRLTFDPPTSSIVKECLKDTIDEMEWRLRAENDDPADAFDVKEE